MFEVFLSLNKATYFIKIHVKFFFFMLKICEKLSNDKTDGVLNVENSFNFLLPKRMP